MVWEVVVRGVGECSPQFACEFQLAAAASAVCQVFIDKCALGVVDGAVEVLP
jgi:hypothetical protein